MPENPTHNTQPVKLLFVLTDDFGEFGTMSYFTRYQPFEDEVAILTTQRLFDAQKKDSDLRIFAYSDKDSILKTVDDLQPEVIVFCSAYLLVINEILPLDDATILFKELHDRPCVLVTTDPLLGYIDQMRASRITLGNFSTGWLSRLRNILNYPLRHSVTKDFKALQSLLQGFVHLYPVPIDSVHIPDGTKAKGFFNKQLILSEKQLLDCEKNTFKKEGSVSWVFIISRLDVEIQGKLYGEQRFSEAVVERLLEAVANGVHVKLIAPQLFLDTLSVNNTDSERLELISNRPYKEFIEILLAADIAFYWNVLSNSAYMRFFNNLPVYFFDPGHVTRIFEGCYDITVKACFDNLPPPFLDMFEEIDPAVIEEKNQETLNMAARVTAQLGRSPTPEQVLGELVPKD